MRAKNVCRLIASSGATLAMLALLVLGGGVRAAGGGRPGGQEGSASPLQGTIDIHVHSYPDNVERSVDGVEAATQAKARGMRGLILKNHYDPTAGLAWMVRKQVPGIEIFGGIDLNLAVGGMNVAAVEHLTQVTGGWGRIVWMSTFDAENQVRVSNEHRPFVRVSASGRLLPETKAVIAAIAKHNLVLATGHVSPAEGLMMLEEGRRVGVQHMVVTHAIKSPVLMSMPQMQQAAKAGAFIEFAGGSMTLKEAPALMDTFVDNIRKVGPQFCIVSTDLGQRGNALPADGFAAIIAALRSRGLTDRELDLVTKQNPARLLGLP
jgi:hypothetical protein